MFCPRSDPLQHSITPMCLALLVALLLVWPHVSAADEPSAHELIRRFQDLVRSRTNVGDYRMQIIRPTWQRSITFTSWDDVVSKRSFVRVLAPQKDKDTTYLKVGANLWMYLPKLERDIKLPPSMMFRPWMGSDFTNDDLVKASSVLDDYTHKTIGRQGTGADAVFTIASLPKPEAAVVWGKLVYRLTAEGMPLEAEFYDEHGKLLRRLVYEDVQNFDGRRLPARRIMQPLDEPGHRTVLEIKRIEFDADIPEAVFELANLSRRGR